MPRDYKVHLEDILEAIQKIRNYTSGHTLKTFAQDAKTLDAVVRNLEVIGEATKKVPEKMRAEHPEVDWRRIAGLRDILVHEYFRVDVEIIWDIVQNKLETLEAGIKSILAV
ncbi:MAG: DUF86 domain-containing protein [Acidobacteriia bacterium]|nr:DUF86 domain-containing protein [Terriglobia bacterium]